MEKQADLSCLSCNSDRIVVGQVNLHRVGKGKPHPLSIAAPAFTPNELRKKYLWPPGLRIEPESGACLCVDCGLVWTSVHTEDAEKTLRKHGSDELKSRLGWED